MIIIGVTGNTGSGKSTVSTIIKNNTGAFIIDADNIVKELMVPGNDYYNDTINLLGKDILSKKVSKKGKIDSNKLAKVIFDDIEKREKLNKLTFKYVGKRTKELILENKDKEFVVLDFPLLYESGFNKICNCIIGVFADEDTKIARIKERDRLSKEQIEKRLNTQIDEKKLREIVDYTIDNSSETRYIGLVKNTVGLIHKIRKDEEEKKKS